MFDDCATSVCQDCEQGLHVIECCVGLVLTDCCALKTLADVAGLNLFLC